MKPAPFDYLAPASLQEALDVMQQYGDEAKLLAGGQSLVPAMNFRLAYPTMLVDLNGVPELRNLQSHTADGCSIGSMVRHSHVEHSDIVAQHAPLLHQTMPYIAHPQIRNRGTIGGSLAHADPAAELPVIMVARRAKFRLQKVGGDRWVQAEDFFQALFTTALEPEEILTEINIPALSSRTGYAFVEFARRHGDYAQVGATAVVTLDDSGQCQEARLVFLNVGDIPMQAQKASALLAGETLTDDLIHSATHLASQEEIDPTATIEATIPYKRHLAQVLGTRALKQAWQKAQEVSDATTNN